MKQIIECVPNFSEGRNRKKINSIVKEIKKIKGLKLLDVDPNPDYNRVVVSFVGEPQAVKDAAFASISKAIDLIDMSFHKGQHPRIGACDVCPFVPIQDVTIEECVELAKGLGKEVGEKLKIPVYLYEEAANRPERKDLSKIREGEYEGLEEKLKNPQWKPDYGEALFNKKSGAIVIGARFPLIAYNVNLKTKDPEGVASRPYGAGKKIADKIAGIVRESGYVFISNEGVKTRIPGRLKNVKAIGVFLKKQGICQVSMNLTNYKATPLHIAFETVKKIASSWTEVKGSEIVGLVPKEAILMAGKFYAPKEKSEEKLIKAAIKNLGLNSLKRFNPKKKIIEYLI